MQKVRVFTSAALNYIPKVRLLFTSLRTIHPDWSLHLVLADELPSEIDISSEPFDEVVPLRKLNLPAWQGWTFCHSIVELSTAVKPYMLSRLLQMKETQMVIYLDPDIVVFSRLDDIVNELERADIVLTPHLIKPEKTLSTVIDNEIGSLKHGIYNLGFIGVAATDAGKAFAQWWSERLYYFCRDDIPNGLFTDQRWIDLVPVLFSGVSLIRSSRHNVAPWNLTTRRLTLDGSGNYFVDGEPLGFYHFTGFDSGDHEMMVSKNAMNKNIVQKLINWYYNETNKIANDPLAKRPWAFNTYSDGSPITKVQRVLYREQIFLQRKFPNPFDASGYLRWWNSEGCKKYPDLIDSMRQSEILAKTTSQLTPGFRAGENGYKLSKAINIIKLMLRQPRFGVMLAKKSWQLLKRLLAFNGRWINSNK